MPSAQRWLHIGDMGVSVCCYNCGLMSQYDMAPVEEQTGLKKCGFCGVPWEEEGVDHSTAVQEATARNLNYASTVSMIHQWRLDWGLEFDE